MDRERVLAEMREIGLSATELGPEGYLPEDADALSDLLARFDLSVVGGFVPAILHRPDLVQETLVSVDRAAATLSSTGASVMVLGPDSHHPGYDVEIELSEPEWITFFASLDETIEIASRHGLVTALHPHWGMAVVRDHHI
jgi:inosose dehydratase